MNQNLTRKAEARWASHLALTLVLVILALRAATMSVAGGREPSRASVPQETQKLPASQRTQIENSISKFMAAHHAPGLSAAVVLNGEEVWAAGFGMADLESYAPATEYTLYRLGSVSKPLTATGAMQLWERGKLDLDAPLQKYCPQFPQKQWPITTRELLGHLEDIRHYKSDPQQDLEGNNTKHFDDPIAGGIQFFANDPLVAQPGTKFNYSTMGCTLVGCAMQGASGETYVDYMRENVFLPAGMAATQPDDRFKIIPWRTRFYSQDAHGATTNADFLDSNYKIPGGGLLSSADDMAKFEAALLNDKLMKRATRDLMWTPEKTSDGKQNGYAMGWGATKIAGVNCMAHSGAQHGQSTVIVLAPEKRDGVVVLVNMGDLDAAELGHDLLAIILAASAPGTSEGPSH
jgi:serine beta-lactamase-like protein LACTB